MTFIIPSKEAWKDAKASIDSVVNKVVVFEEDKKGLPIVDGKFGPTVSINGKAVGKLTSQEEEHLKEMLWSAFLNEVENGNDGWWTNKFLKECAKKLVQPAWNACKAGKVEKPKRMTQAEQNDAVLKALGAIVQRIEQLEKK